jgi:hypothetical protein
MVAVGRYSCALLGVLFRVSAPFFPVIPDLFRDPARRVCGARGSFVWRGQFSHRADARWLNPRHKGEEDGEWGEALSQTTGSYLRQRRSRAKVELGNDRIG